MQTRSPQNPQGALPLHLTLAMLPWLVSNSALQISRAGLPLSKMGAGMLPPLPLNAKLSRAWQQLLSDPKLAQAAEEEARKRATEFLQGLCHYKQTPFARDVEEPPVVLKQGAARLLDYGVANPNAPVLFLIPSLINRYYILDLSAKLSFARYLRDCGVRVFIVDWGTPGVAERHYDCAQYVTELLVPMADYIRANVKGEVILGGYCMGGILAMALAQIRPDLAQALALFATPWDFSLPGFPHLRLNVKELKTLESYIAGSDTVSAETIHTLFQCANPYAFHNKLREFAKMDTSHPLTQEFLAIEHWVNDGVAMTHGVAQDCLIDWAQRNTLAKAAWRVGGRIINPATLKMPCFIAAPPDDKIVPSSCALPLARLIRDNILLEPRSGHVGMMVGSRRKAGLWEPFRKWIDGQFT
jgi:polyhydroxyalkanoate synthase